MEGSNITITVAFVVVLLVVAYTVLAERRVLGFIQGRLGPNRVGPGGMVFAPRGVPHAQRRVRPGEGRQLVLTAPGGFERFFRALADAHAHGTLGPEAYERASRESGVSWVGD